MKEGELCSFTAPTVLYTSPSIAELDKSQYMAHSARSMQVQ